MFWTVDSPPKILGMVILDEKHEVQDPFVGSSLLDSGPVGFDVVVFHTETLALRFLRVGRDLVQMLR